MGDRQEFETLINEEASLLATFLRMKDNRGNQESLSLARRSRAQELLFIIDMNWNNFICVSLSFHSMGQDLCKVSALNRHQ